MERRNKTPQDIEAIKTVGRGTIGRCVDCNPGTTIAELLRAGVEALADIKYD